MKVVVAVKQVEEDLDEWDVFAVEAALQLGEEVVAVTVGDDDEALLTALAMGADRALRIDSGEQLDPIAIARLLAPVVEREAPDLVLCGVQSSDALNAATGVALAALLQLPRVAVVKKLEVADGVASVERELEGGLIELARVKLPAVLTIQKGINEPRFPTLRGIRRASKKPLEVIEAQDVPRAATITAVSAPPAGSDAEMLEGDPSAIAGRIAAIIKAKVA